MQDTQPLSPHTLSLPPGASCRTHSPHAHAHSAWLLQPHTEHRDPFPCSFGLPPTAPHGTHRPLACAHSVLHPQPHVTHSPVPMHTWPSTHSPTQDTQPLCPTHTTWHLQPHEGHIASMSVPTRPGTRALRGTHSNCAHAHLVWHWHPQVGCTAPVPMHTRPATCSPTQDTQPQACTQST